MNIQDRIGQLSVEQKIPELQQLLSAEDQAQFSIDWYGRLFVHFQNYEGKIEIHTPVHSYFEGKIWQHTFSLQDRLDFYNLEIKLKSLYDKSEVELEKCTAIFRTCMSHMFSQIRACQCVSQIKNVEKNGSDVFDFSVEEFKSHWPNVDNQKRIKKFVTIEVHETFYFQELKDFYRATKEMMEELLQHQNNPV